MNGSCPHFPGGIKIPTFLKKEAAFKIWCKGAFWGDWQKVPSGRSNSRNIHNRPFSKMVPTEGGLETGGTACLHLKSGRGRFLQLLLVNIEMPHNCCVPFCNATSKKNKNLRFHRFPKKKGLKDQWIAKIRRDEGDYFAVTENTCLLKALL